MQQHLLVTFVDWAKFFFVTHTGRRNTGWTHRHACRNGDVDIQWLPEQMECRNAQIGKPAVSLWIPMIQK